MKPSQIHFNTKSFRIVAPAAPGMFSLTQQEVALPEPLWFNMISDSISACSVSQSVINSRTTGALKNRTLKKKKDSHLKPSSWHGSRDGGAMLFGLLVAPTLNEMSQKLHCRHSQPPKDGCVWGSPAPEPQTLRHLWFWVKCLDIHRLVSHWRNTGLNNAGNGGWIPFSCFSFRVVGICIL